MRLLDVLALSVYSIGLVDGTQYPVRKFTMMQDREYHNCKLREGCAIGAPLEDDIDINRCRTVDKYMLCSDALDLAFTVTDVFKFTTLKDGMKTLVWRIKKPSYPGPFHVRYLRFPGVSTPQKDHFADMKVVYKNIPMNTDITTEDFSKWSDFDCDTDDGLSYLDCTDDKQPLFTDTDLIIVIVNKDTNLPFKFTEDDLPTIIGTGFKRTNKIHTIPTFTGYDVNYTLYWEHTCTSNPENEGCTNRDLPALKAAECIRHYRDQEPDSKCTAESDLIIRANVTTHPIDMPHNGKIDYMAIVALTTDNFHSFGAGARAITTFNTSWPLILRSVSFNIKGFKLPPDTPAAFSYKIGDALIGQGTILDEVDSTGEGYMFNRLISTKPGEITYIYIPTNLPQSATFRFEATLNITDPMLQTTTTTTTRRHLHGSK